MNKYLKYGLGFSLFMLVVYNSVYFTNLDEFENTQEDAIDFELRAHELYYDGILTTKNIINLADLKDEIEANSNAAFLEFGNRLGIGNSAFFRVIVSGEITDISEAGIEIHTEKGENYFFNYKFIFGNAIRDASGLVELTDYKTNAEFNKLSEALNTLIRETVIPQEVESLTIGETVLVQAALKLRKGQSFNTELNLLPVSIRVIQK